MTAKKPTEAEPVDSIPSEIPITIISIPQGRFMGKITSSTPDAMDIKDCFVFLQQDGKVGLAPTPNRNMRLAFPTNVICHDLEPDHTYVDMYEQTVLQHYSGIVTPGTGMKFPPPPGDPRGN